MLSHRGSVVDSAGDGVNGEQKEEESFARIKAKSYRDDPSLEPSRLYRF